jgi:hypothetical protein
LVSECRRECASDDTRARRRFQKTTSSQVGKPAGYVTGIRLEQQGTQILVIERGNPSP